MLRRFWNLLFCLLVVLAMGASGCTCLEGEIPDTTEEGGGGTGGTGGTGGGIDLGPCGVDCSMLPTPPCTVGVCNIGQEIGPVNSCVVVAAPSGTACDDGAFCTTNDACEAGACVGGPTNDCGIDHSPCEAVICAESTQTCNVAPVNDGTPCTPTDLCKVNGACEVGECIGETKKCTLSPLQECNTVACDSSTGQCLGTPDPFKDNNPCVLTGDVCQVDKACQAGECVGGIPKDCSALDVVCEIGACDPVNGICVPTLAPEGSLCGEEGLTDCEVGTCDAVGECKAEAAPNGITCNDHDTCTTTDVCSAGECDAGSAVAGCSHYLKEDFEVCPSGWTLAGDWECGAPILLGPPGAHAGNNVLATKIAGVYSVNQSFANAHASSPPIDLTAATNPMLSFWAWDHTEGGTFDGWNVKVSTDGTTFVPLTTVAPAYPLTISTQGAYGGNNSGKGWQNYQADLTAFAGQTIVLRFAFRSDAATVYPGVYIDDLYVAEPVQNPLYITTSSIPDVYIGMPMLETITRNGGSPAATWSIVPGGVNTGWLTIDPATGLLSGTPTATDVGPVSVTIRVQEPSLPSNYDEKTFDANVSFAAYYTSFEGPCPNGWTFGNTTWQCGVPTLVGPPTAFDGTQVIATRIAANYPNSQSYATSTATSPSIDLSGSAFPTLTFRMWIDTEGGTSDGVNLKVSTDGGMTFELVDTVVPAYPLTVATQPAWGGQQVGLGWQLMQANLAAYAGQVIQLRFSFRSDASDAFPGIYVDDFLVQ